MYFFPHTKAKTQSGELDIDFWDSEDVYDPLIFDSPLSYIGEQQARAANEFILQTMQFVELVIVSPLTRALQTASIAFHGMDVPLLVSPLLREQLFSSCDVGRSGHELGVFFPELSTQLHQLPADWWGGPGHEHFRLMNGVPLASREPIQAVRARLRALMQLIASRPERSIVLVGHGVLFFHIIGKWLDNCELCPWDFAEGLVHCCCEGCVCRCGHPDRKELERSFCKGEEDPKDVVGLSLQKPGQDLGAAATSVEDCDLSPTRLLEAAVECSLQKAMQG